MCRTHLLQLDRAVFYVLFELLTIAIFETTTILLLRRGRSYTKLVVLPHHRKALILYSFALMLQWFIYFLAYKVSDFNAYDTHSRIQAYFTTNNPFSTAAGVVTVVAHTAFDAGILVYLSRNSSGFGTIQLVYKVFVIGAVVGLAVGIATVETWYPLFLLRISFVVISVVLFLRTLLLKSTRKALLIVSVWIAIYSGLFGWEYFLAISKGPDDAIDFMEECVVEVVLILQGMFQPLVLYACFMVDTVHWKRMVENRGFSSIAASAVRPLMEQMFPSKFLMNYDAFTFDGILGEGAQAEVLRANYEQKEIVAIKRYNATDLTNVVIDTFLAEAVILLEIIPHRHILPFRGVSICPPYLCICSELCDDTLFGFLQNIRRRGVALTTAEIVRFALDVALGMQHLHHHHPKIVHRDLKSMNVLMINSPQDGRMICKVADMGSSRLFDARETNVGPGQAVEMGVRSWFRASSLEVTSAEFLMGRSGTIPWCAPEVLRMEPYSEKCDVFSMGVLLWELATQQVPLTAQGQRIFFKDCVSGFRLPLDDVDDEPLKRLIEQCWDEIPEHRPTFDDIVDELNAMLRDATL